MAGENEIEYWYRFDHHISTTGISICCNKYQVLRHTPKGVWLSNVYTYKGHYKEKFVLKYSKKRFACQTQKAALQDFIVRKKYELRHAELRVHGIKLAQSLAIKKLVAGIYDPATDGPHATLYCGWYDSFPLRLLGKEENGN